MGSFVRWAGDILDQVDDQAARRVEKKSSEEKHAETTRLPKDTTTATTEPPDVYIPKRKNSLNSRVPHKQGSSQIQTLQNEIESLRTVWMETRADLEKAKELLRKREDTFNGSLKEHVRKLQQKHQEQLQQHRDTLAESQTEFELALSAKNESADLHGRKYQELEEKLRSERAARKQLGEKIDLLVAERERLLEEYKESSENHCKVINALKEDYEKQQRLLDHEQSFQESSFQSIKSRESSLEADNVQYVNALAACQRELESKSMQLKRVESEKKWLEADKGVLSDQIKSLNDRFSAEKSELKGSVEGLYRQLEALEGEKQRLVEQCEDIRREKDTLCHSAQDLKRQLEIAKRNSSSGLKVEQLEADIRLLSQQLLEKQDQNEQLVSERNSFRFRFENEARKVQLLEAQIVSVPEHESDDLERGFRSSGIRSRTAVRPFTAFPSQSIPSKTLSRAVHVLDRLGTELSVSLRHFPLFRIGIVLYVVLLHIWVIFVLHHYSHHIQPML